MNYTSAKETPLFKKTYQLLENVENISNGMQRDRKHTIGQFMVNHTLSMFRCVQVANDFPSMREQALIEYLGCHIELSALLKLASSNNGIRILYICPKLKIIDNGVLVAHFKQFNTKVINH